MTRRRSRARAARRRSGRRRDRARRGAAAARRAPGAAARRRRPRPQPRRRLPRRLRLAPVHAVGDAIDAAVHRRPRPTARSATARRRRRAPTCASTARPQARAASPTSTSSAPRPTTRPRNQGCDGHGTINASILAGSNDGSGGGTTDAAGFRYGVGIEPRARLGGTTSSAAAGSSTAAARRSARSPRTPTRPPARATPAPASSTTRGAPRPRRRLRRDRPGVRRDRPRRGALAAGRAADDRGRRGRQRRPRRAHDQHARRRPRTSSPSAPTRASARSATDACDTPQRRREQRPGHGDVLEPRPDRRRPHQARPRRSGHAPQRPRLAGDRIAVRRQPASAARDRDRWASSSPAPPTPRAAAPRTPRRRSPGSPRPRAGPTAARSARTRRPRWSRRCWSAARRRSAGSGAGVAPGVDQGFGMARLQGAATAGRWFDDEPVVFTQSGQSFTRTFDVTDAPKPVRVTLAWTDAPGPLVGASYVNDLDLEVSGAGALYRGNHIAGGVSAPGGAPDPRDNVESVIVPAGELPRSRCACARRTSPATAFPAAGPPTRTSRSSSRTSARRPGKAALTTTQVKRHRRGRRRRDRAAREVQRPRERRPTPGRSPPAAVTGTLTTVGARASR